MNKKSKINELSQKYHTVKSIFDRISTAYNDTALTENQFTILQIIHFSKITETDCTMQSVVKNLHISLPALTQNIDRLFINGLVTREHSPIDRRKVILGLTEKGVESIESYQQFKEEVRYKVFQSLTEEELDQMSDIYQKIITENSEYLEQNNQQ
jgi:DNA-binding MarR family transcriptional regulator